MRCPVSALNLTLYRLRWIVAPVIRHEYQARGVGSPGDVVGERGLGLALPTRPSSAPEATSLRLSVARRSFSRLSRLVRVEKPKTILVRALSADSEVIRRAFARCDVFRLGWRGVCARGWVVCREASFGMYLGQGEGAG